MRDTMMTGALLGVVAGCVGETEFSNTADNSVPETGVASMELSDESILIEDINYSEQISKGVLFTISNVGDNNLQIYLVGLADSGDGAIYIEEETDLSLMPGVSREFSVVGTLTDFVMAEGSLRIKSNDADFLDYRLPVYAYPSGWADVEGSDTGDAQDSGDGGGSESGGSEGDTGSAQ